MNKFKLDVEPDYDFFLLGISCHEKDYRFCWALNNKLGLELKKSEDFEIKNKKQETNIRFSMYEFENEATYTQFYVFANKSEGGLLIPEQKQADYFLIVKGNLRTEQKNELMKNVKDISMVLTAYEIDAGKLKSKQNLVF